MIKIQIKTIWGKVLFVYEKENNTLKDTLIEAIKKGADLSGAYLSGADLRNAKEVPYMPFSCPSDGAFIGWKKVKNCLVMLEIPEDARRCSCTSQKCRCDKAKVLGITDLNTNESVSEIKNTSYSPAVTYVVGEMVYPDAFDEDRWNECSHGIHFFINKQSAIDY